MIIETYRDAILVEIGRRLKDEPPKLAVIMVQNCECMAPPDLDYDRCSECGTPYLEELLDD